MDEDKGQRRVIVGWNQGVSLRFISSLQLWKSMRKGCKLYAILALNKKGIAGRFRTPSGGERESFQTYFQRIYLG
jgi:hypothetical protein